MKAIHQQRPAPIAETIKSPPGRAAAPTAAELQHNLLILQRAAAGSAHVRVDLPAGQGMRMRKLIHRGTQRPVLKIPSIKLARAVHCESLLEGDAALLLDITPSVGTFSEQPLRLHYLQGGQWRSHIPDFVALVDGTTYFFEVKFERDLSELVLSRTAHLKALLRPLGIRYSLLTERNVRQQNVVQNAHRLLRRARHDVPEAVSLQVLSLLREMGRLPLAAFDWSVAASSRAVAIAQIIMAGAARVDLRLPLDDASYVWLAECAIDQEVPAWLPAASV